MLQHANLLKEQLIIINYKVDSLIHRYNAEVEIYKLIASLASLLGIFKRLPSNIANNLKDDFLAIAKKIQHIRISNNNLDRCLTFLAATCAIELLKKTLPTISKSELEEFLRISRLKIKDVFFPSRLSLVFFGAVCAFRLILKLSTLQADKRFETKYREIFEASKESMSQENLDNLEEYYLPARSRYGHNNNARDIIFSVFLLASISTIFIEYITRDIARGEFYEKLTDPSNNLSILLKQYIKNFSKDLQTSHMENVYKIIEINNDLSKGIVDIINLTENYYLQTFTENLRETFAPTSDACNKL